MKRSPRPDSVSVQRHLDNKPPRPTAVTVFPNTKLLADQGLQKLIEGNQRFMRGKAHFPTVCKETVADLARGQHPFATILGCSDSRVPPELIFDSGPYPGTGHIPSHAMPRTTLAAIFWNFDRVIAPLPICIESRNFASS
jgi:hypothetical protein